MSAVSGFWPTGKWPLMTPPFPPALYDAIIPPSTPSGRIISRTQPVHGILDILPRLKAGDSSYSRAVKEASS